MERCLSLTSPGLSVPDLAGLAAWSEGIGYRTVWLSEVAGPDAFVLATATAAATERSTIGIAVVPAYTRTPAVLTMAAASISEVLGGRTFRLGIGSSSEAIVAGWHGLAFEHPSTRVVETVEAVRRGLSGEGNFEGETVAMHRFRPASAAIGPVELYVGALGPGMLAAAGRIADGVCLNMVPATVVPRQLTEVARGAATAGRPEALGQGLPEGFGVMARIHVAVTDDVAGTRQMLRETILGGYLAQPVYNNFLRWMGYEEEADGIAAGWARRDREAVYQAIPDDLVDALAVIGAAGEARRRLEEFGAAGVDQAAISVLTSDRSVVEQTLLALAPS